MYKKSILVFLLIQSFNVYAAETLNDMMSEYATSNNKVYKSYISEDMKINKSNNSESVYDLLNVINSKSKNKYYICEDSSTFIFVDEKNRTKCLDFVSKEKIAEYMKQYSNAQPPAEIAKKLEDIKKQNEEAIKQSFNNYSSAYKNNIPIVNVPQTILKVNTKGGMILDLKPNIIKNIEENNSSNILNNNGSILDRIKLLFK